MAKSININKETFSQLGDSIKLWWANTLDYFQHAPKDELGAWIAIGVGVLLILIALIII